MVTLKRPRPLTAGQRIIHIGSHHHGTFVRYREVTVTDNGFPHQVLYADVIIDGQRERSYQAFMIQAL